MLVVRRFKIQDFEVQNSLTVNILILNFKFVILNLLIVDKAWNVCGT
jgi:hypothetical protein